MFVWAKTSKHIEIKYLFHFEACFSALDPFPWNRLGVFKH